ncbi:RDD family protein [Hymenobacter sp. BT683]|uniref:RDD family protein n=1 Tax=Hymenobacter jeongseonensis TaxID=2791027 RepID=A0ABS0III0_9BACT|nr:RDD family protein [Hymenobacter jeongseonensis]MBF9238172.1 RDD family protein [Hymenobacter jeongseonensis]
MSTIRVHTAQNVTLEYEVASLGDRIAAAIIDNVVLVAWGMAWALLFAALGDDSSSTSTPIDYRDPAGIIAIVLLVIIFLPYVCYNLICEVYFNGQSIGKKARNIKVMRLDGTAPRLGDYLLRWLLRIIDTGIFGGLVAIIAIAASGRGQRLGDMAAGTTVLKLRPVQPHALPNPTSEASTLPGYQAVFPQAAILADHDVALVRQLLHQATTRQNYQLINELANKVKGITGIQTDLPDEAFLHTVLRDHAHLAVAGR